jgi:hypothetical protein
MPPKPIPVASPSPYWYGESADFTVGLGQRNVVMGQIWPDTVHEVFFFPKISYPLNIPKNCLNFKIHRNL